MSTINLNLKKIMHDRDRLQELHTKILDLDSTVDDVKNMKKQMTLDETKILDIENKFEFFVNRDELSTLISDLEINIQDIMYNSTPRNCNYEEMQESINELNQHVTNLISQNDELRRDMTALKKNNNPDSIRTSIDTDIKKPKVPRIINLKRQ